MTGATKVEVETSKLLPAFVITSVKGIVVWSSQGWNCLHLTEKATLFWGLAGGTSSVGGASSVGGVSSVGGASSENDHCITIQLREVVILRGYIVFKSCFGSPL